jgi:pyridoxine 5-phosphate synthase
MTVRLGVNIDHVATLREARKTTIYPDPLEAALLAQQAGAEGITVHLREDRRHIQPHDVRRLKETLAIPINFEMAATEAMTAFACEILPKYCCIVPEKREEITTEGGLDVIAHQDKLKKIILDLYKKEIEVSLFIAPDEAQITATKEVGATIIELHTGEYAEAKTDREKAKALQALQNAAQFANEIGLQVNAGHGLHYHNVKDVAAIPSIVELNIGHAIVSRAVMVGMVEAVKQMKALLLEARLPCR